MVLIMSRGGYRFDFYVGRYTRSVVVVVVVVVGGRVMFIVRVGLVNGFICW